MADAFDQLPLETSKAFTAFTIYLLMGPQERSMEKVGAKLGVTRQAVEKWSERFAWVERARAYDLHMARVEQELRELQIRSKAVEWGKRQAKLKELEWEVGLLALERVREWLRKPIDKMNARDAAYLLDIASKVARLASGMATEHAEHTGEGGGPIKIDLGPMLKKVYGNIIDVNGGTEPPPNLLADGVRDGLPSGADGELCASGDNPAAAPTDGERGSASL